MDRIADAATGVGATNPQRSHMLRVQWFKGSTVQRFNGSNRSSVQERVAAGTPTTVVPGGTSRTTTAPAPTMALAPMFRFGRMEAPMPMKASSPTITVPPRAAFGPANAKSPSTQS